MAWDAVTTAEIAVGEPITNTLLTKVKDDLDYLYGQVGMTSPVGVTNGSFEVDTDADGDPDTWTVTDYSGGSHSLTTTVAAHGLQSLAFVHPGGAGNGGGYAWSDYIAVSELYAAALGWSYYSSNAATKVIVQLRWYDKDQAYLSSTSVLASTSNPTSWTRMFSGAVWPVATARYAKVEIVGGYTDTNEAGTVYFDDIRLTQQWNQTICFGTVTNVAESTAYATVQGEKISTTESDVSTQMPIGGVFRYLYTVSDASTTVTMRVDGADSTLTASNSGDDITHLATVTAGQLVDMKVVTSSATPARVKWGVALFMPVM